MKKNSLYMCAVAVGLLGASTLSHAESSVTLYGLVDTGIGYNKISGAGSRNGSRVGMESGIKNGSRWGLRGSEDLGDGLKAIFQIEAGFGSNNGNSLQGGRLFGRQATVGFSHDSWGQIELGRQTNIASKYFSSIDPFDLGYRSANVGVSMSSANTVRYDNMVMYQSPSFAGFQFGLGYSFSADDKADEERVNFRTNDNVRAITAGARYLNGPLNVALTYDQLNASDRVSGRDGSNQAGATPRAYLIGASYDFEVIKLAAAYGRTTDGWFSGANNPEGASGRLANGNSLGFSSNQFADGFKANSYMIGVSAPVGAQSTVMASWNRTDPSNDRLTGDDATMNYWSLGYRYDLSKRTSMYAYGSYAKNYAFNDDVKSVAGAVGVQHRF